MIETLNICENELHNFAVKFAMNIINNEQKACRYIIGDIVQMHFHWIWSSPSHPGTAYRNVGVVYEFATTL